MIHLGPNNHQLYQIDNNFNKQFYTSRFRLKNQVHSLKQTLCIRLMCKSSSKSFISISNMLYVFFFLNSCHALQMNYRYKVMIFKDPKNFPKSSNCKRRQGLVTKKQCTLFKYLSIFAILYHGLLLVRNTTQRENGLMKFTLFTYMQGSRYGLYKRRVFQTDLKYMNPS